MKICIESLEDGTFSVYDEAAAQGTDPVGTDDLGAQVAATVDEALEIARSLLGGAAEVAAQEGAAASESLAAGFAKGRGVPL